MEQDTTRAAVRERYGQIAEVGDGCCAPSCCGDESEAEGSTALGYSAEELSQLPEGADLGLGSGNPVRAADLQPGEVVVDLGAGAGIDCFLAAKQVGEGGRVIGVDMTPQMVERARSNAREAGVTNVEFRFGEIEALPVPDASADVVISNCVINLSPDRARVLAEAFRVLKPGGRLVISDLISDEEAPEILRESAAIACACLPVLERDYRRDLDAAGFSGYQVLEKRTYPLEELSTHPVAQKIIAENPALAEPLESFIGSVKGAVISAVKPA
jgi:arsenite methyltransferase